MQPMTPPLRGSTQEEAAEPEFVPMNAEQARAWRMRHPTVSPWWVIGMQVLVGGLATLAGWLLVDRVAVAWSLAYGAAAVVLPAALFARGLTGRLAAANPGAAVFGFFLWEMVKVAMTAAMLVAAPWLLESLSWPAMLVGLVVTMKVYWLALAYRRKSATPAAI